MLLSAQPPFDGALDGEFLGHGSVYCGDGVQWFVSDAPQQVDYKDYCKSSYRPGNFPALLTSERLSSNGKSAVWHDAPLPLPHELQEPHNATSVRFKMAGGVVERMLFVYVLGPLRGSSTLCGGVVLVSHDFKLLDQVAEEIWVCDHKAITPWKGSIQSYKQHLRKQMAEQAGKMFTGTGVQ